MHLGLNGLLYGTPYKPPLGGYKPFRVCAVDLSATANCHDVGVPSTPTVQAKGGHTGLIVGTALAGGAAVAGIAAAKSMSTASTGSSGGNCSSLTTQCNNLAAE